MRFKKLQALQKPLSGLVLGFSPPPILVFCKEHLRKSSLYKPSIVYYFTNKLIN